ncbi:DUF547 domain-containing protein [Synechococcus sp. Cruz-9H2]|uniref:DUF547 domain-containing protein n=1 Tax=unclassified Synechococcus TaxID=2626047 RepID=UPI0020CBE680|nr:MULTISPECIES: DUF547 domain-containing protein [unclassified Synechococcus]MCP9819584.1 DUF547 domain-containing protein [Synechococcus sp. Cruz-9H2]MCP9843888.1 DUF547 domain-containing protein [Synechococcus sp. Edmonson 11F2]MCP9855754.1 DUF547 domain-containing protein [Synechococcus sp. Cruz-9C9]MCP9863298.1 DUF547 domain-containing protein [Synechococcus sp. Cruz-7E5]MCP9870389.1 DUF547 domain-containing protein [Synechococcus sp. Cruz-7B9]
MTSLRLFLMAGVTTVLVGCSLPPFATPGSPGSSGAAMSSAAIALPDALDAYGRVLQRHVNAQGLVDYEALQREPADLERTVAAIGAVAPQEYRSWSEAEQIAFLLNAYNAITLASIIQETPLKPSIRDIWGVWNLRRHPVAGQPRTLDAIEHQILRKEFNEPRIHTALVCAAISCPPLRQEPYVAARLEQQLDDQTRRWLAGPHGLRIDRAGERVQISQIFRWFGEDWSRANPTPVPIPGHVKDSAVLAFIGSYLSPEDRRYLERGRYSLDTLPYDWALNRR